MTAIGRLLCRAGLHKRVGRTKFVPCIDAEIVTEVIFDAYCPRCDRVLERDHLVWNGTDMVPAPDGMKA